MRDGNSELTEPVALELAIEMHRLTPSWWRRPPLAASGTQILAVIHRD